MAEDRKKDVTEEEKEAETLAEESGQEAGAGEPDASDVQEPSAEDASEEPDGGNDNSQETDGADGDAKEEGAGETAKKDGLFKKKKKDKRDEQIEELQDKLRRQMAEFDNFRKRSEKEKSQMFDMGARSIIEKFLPVVDNFERGLAAVPEEQREDAFVTGMDKVYKQMLTELEAVGVKPIETEGQEFDPELHNAVMQVESEELGSGTIAQELQKGYTYKDTVVRHSMVSVVS